MVVVSHDRHLLRTTTDDFYLVHGGRVEPFDGDLDDYHKWLGEQEKEANAKPDDGPASANSAVARKIRSGARRSSGKQPGRCARSWRSSKPAWRNCRPSWPRWKNSWPTPPSMKRVPSRSSELLSPRAPSRRSWKGELEWMSLSEELEPWSRPSLRDEQLMASERIAAHELPGPLDFWQWSGGWRRTQPGLAERAGAGATSIWPCCCTGWISAGSQSI